MVDELRPLHAGGPGSTLGQAIFPFPDFFGFFDFVVVSTIFVT